MRQQRRVFVTCIRNPVRVRLACYLMRVLRDGVGMRAAVGYVSAGTCVLQRDSAVACLFFDSKRNRLR